jgi:cell division protein FtsW (lipid II flippase)
VAVCLLYLILFLYGMKISSEARTPFGQYLAAGISFVIFLYAAVHIAVSLGLIPTTGQPLPFISSGGSALMANLFAAGVLLNISRYRRTRAVVNLPPSRGRVFRVERQPGRSRHKVLVLGRYGTRV